MKIVSTISLICISLLFSCTTMKDRWHETLRSNTIESYEAFIERYPASPYVSNAQNKILNIKNQNLWKSSMKGDSSQVIEWINKGANVNVFNKHGNTPLHFAVKHGDENLVLYLISKGANVNKPGLFDDTPLHLARYYHEDEISKILEDAGAIKTLTNKYGLSTIDMSVLRETEQLVSKGASLLNNSGSWTNRSEGRKVYNALKESNENHVINSIVLKVIYAPNIRLNVLILAVKLGIPGSEEKLNDILMTFGSKSMAEDFLNSGSRKLASGGRDWANEHGYNIRTGAGSHRAGWGRF